MATLGQGKAEVLINDEKWKLTHVRQSKYLIQVVKCQNRKCCQPPRTNLPSILPGRFLPPPVIYETTSCGIVCGSVDSKTGHFYDFGTRIGLYQALWSPCAYAKRLLLPFGSGKDKGIFMQKVWAVFGNKRATEISYEAPQ